MVTCLERGADWHMAQVMPLPLTVSCSSKIQIGFTFLVPAYPGCPGKEAVKWLLLLLLLLYFTGGLVLPLDGGAGVHQQLHQPVHLRRQVPRVPARRQTTRFDTKLGELRSLGPTRNENAPIQ